MSHRSEAVRLTYVSQAYHVSGQGRQLLDDRVSENLVRKGHVHFENDERRLRADRLSSHLEIAVDVPNEPVVAILCLLNDCLCVAFKRIDKPSLCPRAGGCDGTLPEPIPMASANFLAVDVCAGERTVW